MQAQEYRVENTLDGQLWIYDRHNGSPIFKFDPKTGDVFIGGQGLRGRFMLQTADDDTRVEIDGSTGSVTIKRLDKPLIVLDGQTGDICYTGELRKLA